MKIRENLFIDAITDKILRIHSFDGEKSSFAMEKPVVPKSRQIGRAHV